MKKILTILLVFCSVLVWGQSPMRSSNLSLFQKYEGNASTFLDESINSNSATNVGTTQTSGKKGNAREYDGTNDRLIVSDDNSLSGTNNLSICAWIYLYTTTDDEYIVVKGDDIGSASDEWEYMLELTASHELNVRISANGSTTGAPRLIDEDNDLPANEWIHVGCTYDGSFLRLYVNGEETVNQAITFDIYNGTADLHIGARFDKSESIYKFFIDGKIDELIISRRAFTDNEMEQLAEGLLYVWEHYKNDGDYEKFENYARKYFALNK